VCEDVVSVKGNSRSVVTGFELFLFPTIATQCKPRIFICVWRCCQCERRLKFGGDWIWAVFVCAALFL